MKKLMTGKCKGTKSQIENSKGITLITLAISRKCVRYEERA